MKISTASKKVLASALSAAMVVAFAPTVAFAGVTTDADKSDASAPVVSGDEVASVVYYTVKDGKTTENVQKFYSDDADTDDNALQAAAAFASNVTGIKAGTAVTVKLNKDVEVATPYAQGIKLATQGNSAIAYADGIFKTVKNVTYYTVSENEAGKFVASELEIAAGTVVEHSTALFGGEYVYNGKALFVTDTATDKAVLAEAGNTAAAATAYVHDTLKVAGKVTLDLNGHTLSNNGVDTLTVGSQPLNYVVAGDSVTKTVTTFVDTVTDATGSVLTEAGLLKAATSAIEALNENAGKTITGVAVTAVAINVTNANKVNLTVNYNNGTAVSGATVTIDREVVDKAIVITNVEKYDVDAAKATFKEVTVDSMTTATALYGKYAPSTATAAVADELSGQYFYAGGVTTNGGSTPGTYRKASVKYTVSQNDAVKTYKQVATLDVTVADSAEAKGAVKASKKAAIVNSTAGATLTINGAAVSSENAKAAVVANNANSVVKLKGGASVAATLEGYIDANKNKQFDAGETNDVYGIFSTGTVEVVEATEAELKANKDAAYDKVATVKADLTKGGALAETAPEADDADAAIATAVKAKTLNVLRNAEFSASSEAAASTSGATAGGTGIGTGVIDTTSTASLASSTAVEATTATLNYGTYEGVFAVKGNADINYGTYNGYVSGTIGVADVKGGKFKYAPTEVAKYIDENNAEATAQGQIGTDAQFAAAKLAVAKGNELYYVYRTGEFTGLESKGECNAGVITMTVQAPKGATKASGAAYTNTNEYLQDKYLNAKTASVVLSEDAVGTALNDGNKTDILKLTGTMTYGNPYSEQDKAKNPEAFAAMEEAATANSQHITGIYGLNLELDYGVDLATGKAVKYQDVTSLEGTELTIGMGPATVDSKPAAYYIADGKATALETKTQDAILAGAAGKALVTTDKIGTFGLTYSSAEDIQNQAEAAELAQLRQQAAALGVQGYETMNKAELTAAIAEAKANGATIEKSTQTVSVAKKSLTVKLGAKKTKTAKAKSFNVGATAETDVTASKQSGSSKITVTKAGKVKLSKGAVKGKTYTAKVSLKAAASDGFYAAAKTITVKFVIK